jgi:hypothetical protein
VAEQDLYDGEAADAGAAGRAEGELLEALAQRCMAAI